MLSGLACYRHVSCPSAMLVLLRDYSTKLYVGGGLSPCASSYGSVYPASSISKCIRCHCVTCLSYDTNETVLQDAFTQHGDIIEVRVICNHVSGKSKGYGFVKFASEDAAASALKEMDGQLLDGRSIRVHYAHKP